MKRTPLRRVSKKRASRIKLYTKIRADFLRKNKYCIVMDRVFGKFIFATEIHHINGRHGARLNDIENFLAVCREGHDWIHNNPAEARRYGFIHTKLK